MTLMKTPWRTCNRRKISLHATAINHCPLRGTSRGSLQRQCYYDGAETKTVIAGDGKMRVPWPPVPSHLNGFWARDAII
eukprot:scaffold3116_cov85-Cyclotella_meneghiniana.AAC.2